jgi:hypothetical protein
MQQPEVEIGLLRRVATLEIEMRQVKEMLRVFENKTFNQSEAARMLNISSNTLARYRRLGMITPIDGNELALILEKVDEQIITEVLSKQPKKVIALDRIFKGAAIVSNDGKVKGGLGCILVARNIEYNYDANRYEVSDWACAIVDNNKIKADTWYHLIDGELKEYQD